MIRVQSKKLKVIIRLAIAGLYFIFVMLMFVFGRTHTIIIDNKKNEDKNLAPFETIEVVIGADQIEMFKNDRAKQIVRGQRQKISIKFSDGKEEFHGEFKIPLFQDSIIVSIPALVKGDLEAVKPFDLYSIPPIK